VPGSECTPITVTRAVTVSSLPPAAGCRWAGGRAPRGYHSLPLVDGEGVRRELEGSMRRGAGQWDKGEIPWARGGGRRGCPTRGADGGIVNERAGDGHGD
jgi:hypothetical protein